MLESIIEKFLKQEGIYELFPEHLKKKILTLPIIFIWVIAVWGPLVYFVIQSRGMSGIFFAVIAPIITFLILCIAIAIGFFVRLQKSKIALSKNDAGTIGSILIFVIPLMLSIELGIFLGSWQIPVVYILINIAEILLILYLILKSHRVYLFFDLISSIGKTLFRSLSFLFILMPLLLVVVLLSVFSQDLWQILGGISTSRLIGILFLLIIPSLILLATSLMRETTRIINNFQIPEDVFLNIGKIAPLKKAIDKGLISDEEVKDLKEQVEWRHIGKLKGDIQPEIYKKTKRWLVLLISLTTLVLFLSFFIYFYLFFIMAFDKTIITDWTGIKFSFISIPYTFLNQSWSISIASTTIVILKTSLILATFTACMSIVYSLTNEEIKNIFTDWLVQKSSIWMAASILYKSLIEPNYQFWEYNVRDEKKGIVRVTILVPKESTISKIEEACNHAANYFQKYKNFVQVTAFEKNDEKPNYDQTGPQNRWVLLHNKVTGFREFTPVLIEEFEKGELRYQHFLGRDNLKKGIQIPNKWFGNTPSAIKLGKAIWQFDANHEWVLHPYIQINPKGALFLNIHQMKHKATSEQYHEYLMGLFKTAKHFFPKTERFFIDLYNRDSEDSLANVIVDENINFVDYKDEKIPTTKQEKVKDWLK